MHQYSGAGHLIDLIFLRFKIINNYCTFIVLKKGIAILILSIYLCTITEAHELLKLPVIFQHFIEHQTKDNNITVFQFLKIHYGQTDVKDDDYARDMQLPFKTTGEFFTSSVSPFVPLNSIIVLPYPSVFSENQYKSHHPLKFYSNYQVNIWQPPKFCVNA